jgi:hypothetical protein
MTRPGGGRSGGGPEARAVAPVQQGTTVQELLRTTGFSASPGVPRVLQLVPGLGTLLAFVASLWMLASMVVAVRQALDFQSTGRAIVVCLVGFVCDVAVWSLAALARGVLLGLGAAVAR